MYLILKGKQGKTLSVSGDTIRIEKKGLVTGRRDKTIPIRNVTSVEVKKPGAFLGFIQFSIAGGKARDSSYTLTGGAFDAVQDENSVVFNGNEKYKMALKIKAYVESWFDRERSDVPRPETTSVADEIRKSSWDFLDYETTPTRNQTPQVASQVKCPHCQGAVQNNPALAGSVVSCPYCQGQFKMPPPPDAIV